MHDCRALEVSIFHTVGGVFVLLSGIGLERLVPGPGRQPCCFLWWVTFGQPLPRLQAELGAADPCAHFHLPLNHFDLGREKEIELLIVW